MFIVAKKKEAPIKKIPDDKNALDFIPHDDSSGVSLAIIEETGYSKKETASYNRIYYIYEGALVLTINDRETFLSEGDACYIEKGMEYEMKGTFKALAVHRTAYR